MGPRGVESRPVAQLGAGNLIRKSSSAPYTRSHFFPLIGCWIWARAGVLQVKKKGVEENPVVSGNRPPPKCRPRVSLHIRKHTSLKSLLFPQLRAYDTQAPLSVYCPHYRLENFAFPSTSTCRTLGCPLRVHHSVAHGGFDAASPAILFGSYARFITFFPVPCII
jgi:hypothetical protein